jgi:hypothetical protein
MWLTIVSKFGGVTVEFYGWTLLNKNTRVRYSAALNASRHANKCRDAFFNPSRKLCFDNFSQNWSQSINVLNVFSFLWANPTIAKFKTSTPVLHMESLMYVHSVYKKQKMILFINELNAFCCAVRFYSVRVVTRFVESSPKFSCITESLCSISKTI